MKEGNKTSLHVEKAHHLSILFCAIRINYNLLQSLFGKKIDSRSNQPRWYLRLNFVFGEAILVFWAAKPKGALLAKGNIGNFGKNTHAWKMTQLTWERILSHFRRAKQFGIVFGERKTKKVMASNCMWVRKREKMVLSPKRDNDTSKIGALNFVGIFFARISFVCFLELTPQIFIP